MSKASTLKKVVLASAIVGALAYLAGIFKDEPNEGSAANANTVRSTPKDKLKQLHSVIDELISAATLEAAQISGSELNERFSQWLKNAEAHRSSIEQQLALGPKVSKSSAKEHKKLHKQSKALVKEAKKLILH